MTIRKTFILIFTAVLLCCAFVFTACKNSGSTGIVECRPEFIMPAPRPGEPVLEFIAVGDAGSGNENQRLVADSMALYASINPIEGVLYLGDNFYESGVEDVDDPQFQTHFEDMYDAELLNIPFYVILGNHDYLGNIRAQVNYSQKSSRWVMPAFYYTFAFPLDLNAQSADNSVQIFALNTTPIVKSQDEGDQLAWLEEQLSLSNARWKIVMGHHPAYSNGDHGGNNAIRRMLVPLFTNYGVDFYVSGHDHDLQILQEDGFHQLVSGAGSRPRGTECEDDSVYAASILGFMSMRFYQDYCEVYVVLENGTIDFAYVVEK